MIWWSCPALASVRKSLKWHWIWNCITFGWRSWSLWWWWWCSVHFSSTWYLCTRKSPFPSVSFETVPVFVWLTMALSRPFKENCRAHPLFAPFTSRWLRVWCSWLCTLSWGARDTNRGHKPKNIRLLNTAELLKCKPLVMVALPASLLGHFPSVCLVQGSTCRWQCGEDSGDDFLCLPVCLLSHFPALSRAVHAGDGVVKTVVMTFR